MGELYGELSKATNEWKDGLVAYLVREAVRDTTPIKKWITFDGPVDALWIESMNTVLDDNKMLCLANAERIKLPQTVTMLFEVNDLAQASPATVSRCGMVYIEAVHLGWLPLVESWSPMFAEQLGEKYVEFAEDVKGYLVKYLEQCLKFVKTKCTEMIPSTNNNLVSSCLNLLSAILKPEFLDSIESHNRKSNVGAFFIFSLIWSVGANIHDKNRKMFSEYVKKELVDVHRFMPFEGELYDYAINVEHAGF